MAVTTVTRLRRALRTVALCLTLAAAAAIPAGVAQRVAAADAPTVTILLDGLCSELSTGEQFSRIFDGDDGIAARLIAAGRPASSILGYSYAGGVVNATTGWQPRPYGCAESRDHSLAMDVDVLDAQLNALAAAHPGARFELIGFSMGGLVAFAELARMDAANDWTLPNGASLGAVVTLDSPLGGAPFIDVVCDLAPDVCGGTATPGVNSVLRDMSRIWDSATGTPAGATRSIAADLPGASGSSPTNQQVALAASDHRIHVLSVGNVRDWLYAPTGPKAGALTFLDSQWLWNGDGAATVWARAIDAGPSSCPASAGDLAAAYTCNHPLVIEDAAAFAGILAALDGSPPLIAATCKAGVGGCLALPPRPATFLGATIAAGVVSGGGHFGTSSVAVKSGGRATLLFTTSPKAAGKRIEIWGRSKTGAYSYMTTRVADSKGVVRYYTPPITGWAAIQARYAGDNRNGPGVSPGRVVTVGR